MKLILLSEDAVRLEPEAGPMTIESVSAEQSYSPFHMMAGALAYCTFSVMYAWAENASFDGSDLTLEVHWTFADDPHRVDAYHMSFEWPSLPEKRLNAALRVAELCTVHATFRNPPDISIVGTAGVSGAGEHAQADGITPGAAKASDAPR